jgi:tetratricopeptide (TPR) repeat protein
MRMTRPGLAALACLLGVSAAAQPASQPGSQPASQPASRPLVERPGDWGAYLAGRAAGQKLDTPAAVEYMARALAADPESAELVGRTMLAALADGRDLQAVLLARRQAARNEASLMAGLILLAEDAKNARFDDVARRAASLPRQSAGPILGPVLAAWAAAGEGDPARGFEMLQALADGERLKGFYAISAALLADRAGKREEATRLFAVAREAPLPGLVVVRVAQMIAARGDAAEATRLETALSEGADDSGLLQGRLAAGVPVVPDAAAGMAETLFALGAIVRAQDSGEFALLLARLALLIRPDHAAALMLVADVLDADDRHDVAAAAMARVPETDPLSPLARLRAALLLERAGKTEESLAALHRLADAYPDRPQPWARMGDVLRGRKRFAEAADAYGKALDRIARPLPARAWAVLYARGMSLERSQQWREAEADFVAALELSPEQPYVLNYLAYTWVDRGEHLDRGKAMLERAVELAPNDGHIVDSLGWALYRLGDFAGAVKQLERAVELEPADAVLNDHLGDAYWRVGRRAEARFQWQRALSSKPEPEDAAKIEAKLRDGLPDEPRTPAAQR